MTNPGGFPQGKPPVAFRGGFTLIELMIVVAIIGILAAVAIPHFADLTRRSNEGETKGNLASLRSAISIYYGDLNGEYPQDLPVLTVSAKYMAAIPTAKTPSYHGDLTADVAGDQATDAGGWLYDNVASDANVGAIWVNCTHTDSKLTVWTSY